MVKLPQGLWFLINWYFALKAKENKLFFSVKWSNTAKEKSKKKEEEHVLHTSETNGEPKPSLQEVLLSSWD